MRWLTPLSRVFDHADPFGELGGSPRCFGKLTAIAAVRTLSQSFLVGGAERFRTIAPMAWRQLRLLSLLKRHSPRPGASLPEQMGMTRTTVRQTLRQLQACGLVEELTGGSFALSGGAKIFEIETIAFELRLKNARRAVFQTQQYTLFAQQVWIVVPPCQGKSYDAYRPVLARWGIGLGTFNPNNHRFNRIVNARRRPPGSREHQAYAVLRLVGT